MKHFIVEEMCSKDLSFFVRNEFLTQLDNESHEGDEHDANCDIKDGVSICNLPRKVVGGECDYVSKLSEEREEYGNSNYIDDRLRYGCHFGWSCSTYG